MPEYLVSYLHHVKVSLDGFTPWRDDLYLPKQWKSEVHDQSVPYVVTLDVVVEAYEPNLESVTFSRKEGGPFVAPRVLRQARLSEYLGQAATLVAFRATLLPDGSGLNLEPTHNIGDSHVMVDEFSGAGRRGRLTDGFLASIGEVYNAAVARGSRTPRKAVQEDPRWKPVATQTAANWVRVAKDRGFIPPRKPTKPTKRPQQRPKRRQ